MAEAELVSLVVDEELVPGASSPGLRLVWDDVKYSVASAAGTFEVLHGVSGSARAGRLLAVMGSSGAGKTCLLDALAGRLGSGGSGKGLSGSIRLEEGDGGGTSTTFNFNPSYVPQEDILLNSATVQETFQTAALLRLGPLSESDLRQRVDSTIRDLKLESVRHSYIGGADIRGISGGERRRTSIGQEICSNEAPVLLLDEPTTGLDSKTAESVMQNIIELARRKGTVVICTIHQPNSLITSLFDDLLLLAKGRCVYFGPMGKAVEAFQSAGFICPPLWNPTDFFLHVLDNEDNAQAVYEQQLQQRQEQQRQEQAVVLAAPRTSTASTTSVFHQTAVLVVRNARQWIRDPAMFASELLQYIFLALFIGGMYANMKNDVASGVFSRTAGIFIILSVLIFTPPFTAITVFSLERHLFLKERKDRFYSSFAWVLAKSIVTFPVEGSLCFAFSVIVYFMMNLQRTASKFFIFFGILLLFQLIAESAGLLFAIANKSPVYAIVWLSLILIVALSLAGFLTYEMPPWYSWIQDANVLRFALLALLINEMDGLRLTMTDAATGATVYVDGISALPVGLQPSQSLAAYVGILIGVLVGLRVAVVLVLHFTRS